MGNRAMEITSELYFS